MRGKSKTTIHHRRPQSCGGMLTTGPNTSNVPIGEHRAWTTLTENIPPKTIAIFFGRWFLEFYGREVDFYVEERCDKIHAQPYPDDKGSVQKIIELEMRKIRKSWNILFNNCEGDPKKLVKIVNEFWLDPDYEMCFRESESSGRKVVKDNPESATMRLEELLEGVQ